MHLHAPREPHEPRERRGHGHTYNTSPYCDAFNIAAA